MTPDQYREAIATLGLSQVKAAALLGVNERTSRDWAKNGAPPSAAVALAALVFIKTLGLDPLNIPAIREAARLPAPKPQKA